MALYHVVYRVMVDRTVAVEASSPQEAVQFVRNGNLDRILEVEEESDDVGNDGENIGILEVFTEEENTLTFYDREEIL